MGLRGGRGVSGRGTDGSGLLVLVTTFMVNNTLRGFDIITRGLGYDVGRLLLLSTRASMRDVRGLMLGGSWI